MDFRRVVDEGRCCVPPRLFQAALTQYARDAGIIDREAGLSTLGRKPTLRLRRMASRFAANGCCHVSSYPKVWLALDRLSEDASAPAE